MKENNVYYQNLEKVTARLNELNGVKVTNYFIEEPVETTGKELRALIFLRTNNLYSLSIITRVFDRRYSGTLEIWTTSLDTDDLPDETGKYPLFSVRIEARYSPDNVNYFVNDCETLIGHIKHWTQPQFDNYFKRYHFDINI